MLSRSMTYRRLGIGAPIKGAMMSVWIPPLPGLFAADTPALIRSPPHTRYFTYVPARFQKYVMAHVILRIRSGFQQGRLPVEQTRRRAGVLVVVRTCRQN